MSQNLFAGRVEPVQLEEEIQRSYLDYAMSVIVGRALPDVRDGLKPVHRRILWSMFEQGLRPDRPYRKSANVVGGVMSKYHPHGRHGDLRRPGADGPGLLAPVSADRPARELRLGRRRPGRRLAVHRVAPGRLRHGDAPRDRVGHGRLRPELRRVRAGAHRPAEPVPEPAGQRRRRDRGGHGHEHPAAQRARGHRRRRPRHRSPRCHARRAHEVREGPRLPHRRHDHRVAGDQGCVRDGAGLHQGPRGHDHRGRLAGPLHDRGDGAAVPGQQGPPGREDRRPREVGQGQGHRGRAGSTPAAARACAWWSS